MRRVVEKSNIKKKIQFNKVWLRRKRAAILGSSKE
jgi:hypothetical protein